MSSTQPALFFLSFFSLSSFFLSLFLSFFLSFFFLSFSQKEKYATPNKQPHTHATVARGPTRLRAWRQRTAQGQKPAMPRRALPDGAAHPLRAARRPPTSEQPTVCRTSTSQTGGVRGARHGAARGPARAQCAMPPGQRPAMTPRRRRRRRLPGRRNGSRCGTGSKYAPSSTPGPRTRKKNTQPAPWPVWRAGGGGGTGAGRVNNDKWIL